MEEQEVEILEPITNYEKELPVPVDVTTVKVPIQQFIINGEKMVVMGEAPVLCCPKCRTIIKQFPAGIPVVEVLKSINTDDNKLKSGTLYCQKCGQKLKIFRDLPVNGTFEVK